MKKIKEEFPELPKVRERKRKVYIISALFFIFFWYTGIGIEVLDKMNVFNQDFSEFQTIIVIIVIYSIISLILFFILKEDIMRDTKYYFKNFKKYCGYGISLLLMCWAFSIIITLCLNYFFDFEEISDNEKAILEINKVLIIIYGIFLAPFCEECVFRGLLKKILKNKYIFIAISTILFGIMHLSIRELTSINILNIVPYATSGFILAYNYQKTNNLTSSLAIHMLNNTITLGLGLFLGE